MDFNQKPYYIQEKPQDFLNFNFSYFFLNRHPEERAQHASRRTS